MRLVPTSIASSLPTIAGFYRAERVVLQGNDLTPLLSNCSINKSGIFCSGLHWTLYPPEHVERVARFAIEQFLLGESAKYSKKKATTRKSQLLFASRTTQTTIAVLSCSSAEIKKAAWFAASIILSGKISEIRGPVLVTASAATTAAGTPATAPISTPAAGPTAATASASTATPTRTTATASISATISSRRTISTAAAARAHVRWAIAVEVRLRIRLVRKISAAFDH